MKKTIVLLMTLVICLSLCACGKSAEAAAVDEMILAIGEVTIDNVSSVEAAVEAYNALSDKDRESVENYEMLKEAQEDLFYIEFYELTNKLLEVYYNCQNVSNGTRIIWDNVGSSDFWTTYNSVRTFNMGLTLEEYDEIFMEITGTKAYASIWAAARGLCPSYVDGTSITYEGKETTIELCHSFNACYDFISENMDPLCEEIWSFVDKYESDYEDEVETLNDLCLELDMYVDFALEPSGTLNDYTSTETDYKNAIDRLVKVMDSYA